jgi:hypothetical protein
MKLLTEENSSPKLAKNKQGKYLTAILYLAGSGDPRLCKASSPGCRKACLVTNSGRGIMNSVKLARQGKSNFYFNNPIGFKFWIKKDIESLIKKANKLGKKPAVRLNGGSDLDWTDIYNQFPDVQFWEYVADPVLAVKLSNLKNVHVTFSRKETTTNRILGRIMSHEINVAMVFDLWSKSKGKLPKAVGNVPVIDGDKHDLRFLDPQNVIVGLRFKSTRKPGNNTNDFLMKTGA